MTEVGGWLIVASVLQSKKYIDALLGCLFTSLDQPMPGGRNGLIGRVLANQDGPY